MILRTFKLTESQALRLSNLAQSLGESPADLVRQFLDEYLRSPDKLFDFLNLSDRITLRSFYITTDQDDKMKELSVQYSATVGMILRRAIDKGLGK